MKLTIHQNGNVTLHANASDFAILLADAARQMNHKSEPNRDDVLRMAEQLAHWHRVWKPDASETELDGEIRRTLNGEIYESKKAV